VCVSCLRLTSFHWAIGSSCRASRYVQDWFWVRLPSLSFSANASMKALLSTVLKYISHRTRMSMRLCAPITRSPIWPQLLGRVRRSAASLKYIKCVEYLPFPASFALIINIAHKPLFYRLDIFIFSNVYMNFVAFSNMLETTRAPKQCSWDLQLDWSGQPFSVFIAVYVFSQRACPWI
jgi:hypothetical protein